MAVFGINYDEGNKLLNYKSVYVSCYDENLNRVFDTGNFVKDWFDLIKYIITELSEIEPHFTGSSSIDHFFMDGANNLYDSAYLHVIDGEPVLKYLDRSDPNWYITQQDICEGTELYVLENTQPSWNELKEMCK
jgi:hypothetical protein